MSIIPFDDRDGYIWLNGEMMLWRECKTHVISPNKINEGLNPNINNT